MPRMKHDRPGLTYACPACDATTIYIRTGNGNCTNHPERPYSCEKCGVALTYVIERPRKNREGRGELPKQQTLGFENGPRQRRDRDVNAIAPEDMGLSPIGVRSGQP